MLFLIQVFTNFITTNILIPKVVVIQKIKFFDAAFPGLMRITSAARSVHFKIFIGQHQNEIIYFIQKICVYLQFVFVLPILQSVVQTA